MAIKFTDLELRNFMSYGNQITKVNLDNNAVTLIVGENLDDQSAGSNGVGKTTIANALTYCLYDKALVDIKVDELINNTNTKNMVVVVRFYKDGDAYYEITRARKWEKRGNTFLSIKRNPVENVFTDNHDITSTTANYQIQSIIGMDYHMFIRIIVISATHQSFLRLPVSSGTVNQVDFIEQLFDLGILTEKSEVLKQFMKDTNKSIDGENNAIQQYEKELAKYESRVAKARQRVAEWDGGIKDKINKLNKQLAEADGIDIDAEKAKFNKVETLKSNIKELNGVITQNVKDLADIKKKLKEVEHEYSHLKDGHCPYCNQSFRNEERQERIKTEIVQYEHGIKNLTETINEMSDQKDSMDDCKSELERELKVKNIDQITEIFNNRHNIMDEIVKLQNSTNVYLGVLEDEQKEVPDKVETDLLDELLKIKVHQDFLHKLLTKKDSTIRKAILNQNLPYLNQRMYYHLESLGMIYKVQFNQDMTPCISHFGRQLSFNNLSNGQQARVNIAISMSFRDILQKLHEQVNIMFLDECLDVGLDNSGVSAAVKMLKHKAKDEKLSMFVISHRDEITSMFSHILRVQMKGGYSFIVE